jgi:uncharacterized protein YfaS (alpha-2-macroglobulin family)
MKRRWSFLVPALLIVVTAVMLQSFQSPEPKKLQSSSSATYSADGVLHVDLPYRTARAGSGQLIVELLTPEDEVLARIEKRAEVAPGSANWREELKPAKPLPVEDLVWHRVRGRFVYDGAGGESITTTESVSGILRRPVLRIIGQQSYLAGATAAVRAVVTDAKNQPIAGNVRVELIEPNGGRRPLFRGRANERGAAEAQFQMPAGLTGNYQLRYVAETSIGSTEFVQPVRIQNQARILLTTEKPIYQPGQTIHARALALDRGNRNAAASRNLVFEVEDSRGNKVFKRATQTDRFGIASADFALAEEVNLGTYHLRALLDGENTADVAIQVERYVLPKFKVAVEFTGKARHGYAPGDLVTGVVRANYFFGKPVEGEVVIKATGIDAGMFEAATVKGKTDAAGDYRFEFRLPNYFAGRPLSAGAARVLVEASVKDSAGHSETRGEPIVVSQSPILLTAIPESGSLVPNLENAVYVLASYPDGNPARTELTVHVAGQAARNVTTDEAGVATVSIPGANQPRELRIDATDREGLRASATVPLGLRAGAEQVLLRADRAVYRAGDRIAIKVFSTKERGAVYLDVVKDRQTILTRDVDLVNGQAELTLTATPELAGTLDLNAYLFGRDAVPVADHRLVFVQPADDLKIEASTDSKVYRPGDDARVRFRVTNSRGEGVQAALGVQVVDEAVFALAEKQPGFAKVFFYLEQEVMKPRYEIHSIGMSEVVETAGLQRDRAARALFAATELVNDNRFQTVAGRELPQAKRWDYAIRYRSRLVAAVSRRPADFLKSNVRDGWDQPVKIARAWENTYLMRSAGPDKQFDTDDDLAVYVAVQMQRRIGGATSTAFDVAIEHDRGPNNGRAEISGSIVDETGTGLPGLTITARQGGTTRRAQSGPDGRFTISAVPAGDYRVEISGPGFRSAAKDFALAPRDRAALSARLQVSAVTEVAMLKEEDRFPMRMRFDDARQFAAATGNGGVVGGVPGGVAGGVLGGIVAAVPVAAPAPPVAKAVLERRESRRDEAPAARVRSYFPEALYINPSLITDQNGNATITIPLADSITTWRMALTASTTHGALGSGTGSIKVFQDFFTDLDLPVTLTQGDRVSIPVAVYNYAGSRGDVALRLEQNDWFNLVGDTAEKTVAVDSGRVGGSQFTLEAKRIGKFKLTLHAGMSGAARRADIVVREIEVVPNGREQTSVFNGRLESTVQHTIDFPAAAIRDAGKIFVRLYPGPLSQVIEGMDAILRMPYGCFEQTSSATYPNILALDYMKRTKKLTPEVRAKAEGFIANGYQRLLTYEVQGGGFSWFGNPPANKILTAYGLMEFGDMAKVYEVDPRLIQRTQQWLASQQQGDGSWKPDAGGIQEGATNRYVSDTLRVTAYIAWSLENTGYRGPAIEKARQYIDGHRNAKADAYTLAVVANFAADYPNDRAYARQAVQQLVEARTEKDEQAWWTAEETAVFGRGESAAIETTGLAVQALLKTGESSVVARKALNYLAAKKDANGTWGTTQATIMALRAILLSTEKGSADVRGTVQITLNGTPAERLTLTPENNDLLHQFVLKNVAETGSNRVEIRFDGKGGLAYQVAGRYFLPWTEKPAAEPLSIDVNYDRTRLAQDDLATATAVVRNNLPKTANMVMIDLGIPPGFDLLSEDLQEMQQKTAGLKGGRLEKFSLTATQAILYFDAIPAGGTVTVKFRLRAKYPIRARTFRSRVYEYYDPDVNAVAKPVLLEVAGKR